MSIVKNLVDMMDGTIDIKKREGQGNQNFRNAPFRIAEQTVSETVPPSHNREAGILIS